MYNFTLPTPAQGVDRPHRHRRQDLPLHRKRPEGLAGGKRVIIALARGGIYSEGSPAAALEHLETYLRGVFNFIGIEPEFVAADGLNISPEQREQCDRAGARRDGAPRRLTWTAAASSGRREEPRAFASLPASAGALTALCRLRRARRASPRSIDAPRSASATKGGKNDQHSAARNSRIGRPAQLRKCGSGDELTAFISRHLRQV